MKSMPEADADKLDQMQNYLSAVYAAERHLGIPFKWLLLLAGIVIVWGTGQTHTSFLVLLAFILYGMANVLASYLFYVGGRLVLPVMDIVLFVSYLADIFFATVLIYFTGAVGSEFYLLYCLLATKGVLYYPVWRPLLLPLYLSGPAYILVLYYSSRSFFFLTDRLFLIRYGLLLAVVLAVTYLGWLLESKQKWIGQLTRNLQQARQDLESKTELMQRTAQDLGNRVMELRTLQEGVKAINSALALENVLRLIVTNAAQVLEGARCSIALVDRDGDVVTLAASGTTADQLRYARLRRGEGIVGWVVEKVKPVLSGDVRRDPRFKRISPEPVVSMMSVPLISGKYAIGALSATSPRPNAFSAEDLGRLEAFADQAAIAVKNSRLYEGLAEEKKRTEENMQQIIAVTEVSRAIVSLLDLEEILELIIERLAQLAGTSHCAVALYHAERDELVGRLAKGPGTESFRNYRIPLSDDPATAQAIQQRQAAVVEQADASANEAQRRLASMWQITSYLVCPLLAKDRIIGTLYLADARPDFRFGEKEFQLITSFSYFAATAIENAQLYQNVWEKSTELEAILRGIGDGVIVTDPQMNLLLMNPVAARIFRLSRDVPTGTYLPDLVQNEALITLLHETLESQDRAVIKEIEVSNTQDGKRSMIYQGLAAAMASAEGHPRGIVVVLRDITSQKELERMKSNFLSVVSHELKTPLHSIKGFVDIILMGKTGDVTDVQRDFLTTVKQQTGQLQTMINDLLEFSRLESGQVKLRLEEVSLPDLASRVVEKLEPLADDGGLTLQMKLPATFPVIEADEMRLEQVLTNLVDNAIKFTAAGGTVTIDGRDLGEEVQVWVHDTGIGIPPDQLEKIFDRFYQVDGGSTRPYRGTGLGLTICKHIVEHHHGRIWAESKQGEGSTFFFILPKKLSQEEELSLDFTTLPSERRHSEER